MPSSIDSLFRGLINGLIDGSNAGSFFISGIFLLLVSSTMGRSSSFVITGLAIVLISCLWLPPPHL